MSKSLADQVKIQLMYDENIKNKKSAEEKATDEVKRLKRRLKKAKDENFDASL